MQLTYINASPRAQKSNTEKHLDYFIRGFEKNSEADYDRYFLNHYRKKHNELSEIFWESENVLIGFPLYIDCVPGTLKAFMEALPRYKKGRTTRVFYFSQCGFPETAHLRYVERYLNKYTRRIGCTYIGSMMRGGGEAIHIQPPQFWEKTKSNLQILGKFFGENGSLEPEFLQKLSYPESLEMDQIKGLMPYANAAIWDNWLKGNDALEKSFDRPYKAKN